MAVGHHACPGRFTQSRYRREDLVVFRAVFAQRPAMNREPVPRVTGGAIQHGPSSGCRYGVLPRCPPAPSNSAGERDEHP